jgi:hypothetical protein
MRTRVTLTLLIAVVACASVLAQVQFIERQTPVRTFSEFVGTWTLDQSASSGRMRMAPPPAVSLRISTNPNEISVTSTLDLPPETPGREGKRLATNTPPPKVYRLNGAPTLVYGGQYEYSYTFQLVADALVLTEKTSNWVRRGDPLMSNRGAFTMVTDALSVDGDTLTLHRQLTSVNGNGQIYVMSTPEMNRRQTYVYRRAAP